MIEIDRPAMGPREERDLEAAMGDAAQNRADLEFLAAMGGVELESMAAQERGTGEGGEAHE